MKQSCKTVQLGWQEGKDINVSHLYLLKVAIFSYFILFLFSAAWHSWWEKAQMANLLMGCPTLLKEHQGRRERHRRSWSQGKWKKSENLCHFHNLCVFCMSLWTFFIWKHMCYQTCVSLKLNCMLLLLLHWNRWKICALCWWKIWNLMNDREMTEKI